MADKTFPPARIQHEETPEGFHAEQEDEGAQAHTVAEERLDGEDAAFGLSDSEKVSGGIEDANAADLVDHMNEMVTSGRIDMSAFRGERNDDDEEGSLGPDGREDDFPSGAD